VNQERTSNISSIATGGFVSARPDLEQNARVHEQMNALSIISTVASLLTPGLSDRDLVRMQRLNRAVDRLAALIRNEGDDGQDAEARAIDVEQLVRGVCDRLHRRAEEAGIELVVECGGGSISGDGPALRETLQNLVGNAIDATLPGRTVHLETRSTATGDQIWTIKDSGTGMPAHVMRSASVAMSHGGSLAFESREGTGTTVHVWLPAEGPGARRSASGRSARPVETVEVRDQA